MTRAGTERRRQAGQPCQRQGVDAGERAGKERELGLPSVGPSELGRVTGPAGRWERALGWPWAALGRLGKEVWAGSWVWFWVFPFYFSYFSKSNSNKV